MECTKVLACGCFAIFAIAACANDRTIYVDGAPSPNGTTNPDGPPSTPGDPTPGQPDKPGCAKTSYTETLPTSAALPTFANTNAWILSALGARYPLGKAIVEGGLSSSLAQSQGNCIDRFLPVAQRTSQSAVLRNLTTVVHECGHFYDLGEASGNASAYVIRSDLKFTCSKGDTTSRGGTTFARSLLKTDTFYAAREACGGQASQGCDFYADIYLDGSATNATFESGDQGYSSVLEEATQYVNSVATALAFKEAYNGAAASERDGILTFLWYIERYLAMAKAEYPNAYKTISGDACWRQATLSVWDRGWFYLEATKGNQSLGIDDDAIEALVKTPALVAEIDALRALECP